MSKRRRRHSAEQIVKKLREANAMLAAGRTVGEVLLRTAAQKLAERTVLFDKRAIGTLASCLVARS